MIRGCSIRPLISAVPVVLSGHTHGGQIVLPVIGAPAGRKFPVLAGSAVRERTSIFVSRGVGTVYIPVRLNCPPEVAVLTLRRAGQGAEQPRLILPSLRTTT